MAVGSKQEMPVYQNIYSKGIPDKSGIKTRLNPAKFTISHILP